MVKTALITLVGLIALNLFVFWGVPDFGAWSEAKRLGFIVLNLCAYFMVYCGAMGIKGELEW